MALTGLFKAIKHFGSQNALAEVLGVTQQAVSLWINRDEKIPDLYALLKLFCLLKGSVSLQDLRTNPDEIRSLLKSSILFDAFPAIEVPINQIVVVNTCSIYRTPEEAALNLSMADLYKPILIDKKNRLITCQCRLSANFLSGRKKIFVHQIDLQKILQGKFSISQLLHEMPISEKVAIGLAIERELGNRQGQRIDLALVDNYPQVSSHQKTRSIAAEIAGFSSDFSYRQAKFVVSHGIPPLIQLMDKKTLAVSKAKKLAELPEKEQLKKMAFM